MASDTKNVKLGVCKVFYAGVDLGYTKGGVEVTVKTDTHKVSVDQFGKSSINEYVMGRDVMAKVPLAETTVENMVAIMPGASMVSAGGSVATGTITFTGTPVDNDTITINGKVFTYETTPLVDTDLAIPATANDAASELAAKLNASNDPAVAAATYSANAGVVTVTYGNALTYGATGAKLAAGNAFTLAENGTASAVSGATLTGGADATSKYVEVTNGVGADLLLLAHELRLHPVGKLDSDKTEDFVIPLAGTAGALTFAYKLEDERIYNVEFNGYPDPVTQKLFMVGK